MANANDNMDKIFSDDLNMEPTVQADENLAADLVETPAVDFAEANVQSTATAQKNNLPQTKPVSAPVAPSVIPDFNYDGLGDIPGVLVGDIGLEISRLPVEKAKFTKDSRALIAIISPKVVAVKVHYRENLGSYLCFGGKCCETDGLARVKYLFPVIIYDTDKKGSPVSTQVTKKVLALGKDQYDDIKTMAELNGSVTDFDILVTCKDEQYQKLSFQLAGACRWKRSKALVNDIVTFWKDNIKHIVKPIARRITENDLMQEVSGNAEVAPQADVQFGDVFNDK